MTDQRNLGVGTENSVQRVFNTLSHCYIPIAWLAGKAFWRGTGSNQFAEFQQSANDGYGVEIPHGQSAAFNTASTVRIDNGVENRGPEYTEWISLMSVGA
jgi:hypothetical protein